MGKRCDWVKDCKIWGKAMTVALNLYVGFGPLSHCVALALTLGLGPECIGPGMLGVLCFIV